MLHIGALYHTCTLSVNIYISVYISQQWLTKLTLRCRVLDKTPVAQLRKNSPTLYGTRSFIIVFIRARHWSLSWASWMQSIPSYPISRRSIVTLRLRFSSGLVPSVFQNKTLRARLTHACYFPCQLHPLLVDNFNISWRIRNMKLLKHTVFSNRLLFESFLGQIFSSAHRTQIPLVYILPLMSESNFHITA
jgi:hypothetical protein